MKRKRSSQGLFTDSKIAEEKTKDIEASAEHHLNALRKGHARLLAWSSQGTLVFAPPSSDTLSPSNSPGDIYGQSPRLYATVPTYKVPTKRSVLLLPVAQRNPIENTPIDHILFNELGSHLAVVDELGSIAIWEQDNYAAHLIHRESFPADNDDTTHASGNRIICLRWLHNDSKVHIALKLAKNGDQWNCQGNSQRGYGPCNLVGREAFIAVTSDGRVKLVLQSPKGWRMKTLKLEGGDGEAYEGATGIARDLISHAAWSQDFFTSGQQAKEHNILGVAALRHDPAIGQCLSFYKLTVEFRQDQENPVRLSSSILVNRDPLDLGGDVTHFFVLPTSNALSSALAVVTLRTDEFGERKSSLALWDIMKSTTALHATFSHLTSVSNIPAPKDEAYSISLKQRCELPGVVVSADIRIYASSITLGYLDGSVEVRKRGSIDKAEEPLDSSKSILTPFDGGFSFPKLEANDDRYIASVFSPNLVAYATLHASGQVRINPMQSDPSSSLVPVVLALRFTNALKKNTTFDDIYLVAEQYMNDDFAMKLIQQLLRFSSCRFEMSKDLPIEQILSGRVWDKIVSIQYNIYSRLDSGAKVAGNGILLLQLRAMFVALMMSCKAEQAGGTRGRTPQNMGRAWLAPKSFPTKEAVFKEYAIVALLGYVQWLMDYLVFVVRELLLVAKDLRQKHYEKEQDIPTMASMIFATVVRTFLRAGIRASTDLLSFAKRYVEQGVDVEPVHIHAYTMLESTIRQSPISLEFAGKFLEDIDTALEKILSEHPNKADIENKLFLESVIPRALRRAIYTVTGNLIGPQSPLDIPAVIFFDTTWLGLSTIRSPGAQYLDTLPNATLWDTLRKQRLNPGRVRKCNRCGILSAIDDPTVINDLVRRVGIPGFRNWTALFMRNCICFGTWSLSELD